MPANPAPSTTTCGRGSASVIDVPVGSPRVDRSAVMVPCSSRARARRCWPVRFRNRTTAPSGAPRGRTLHRPPPRRGEGADGSPSLVGPLTRAGRSSRRHRAVVGHRADGLGRIPPVVGLFAAAAATPRAPRSARPAGATSTARTPGRARRAGSAAGSVSTTRATTHAQPADRRADSAAATAAGRPEDVRACSPAWLPARASARRRAATGSTVPEASSVTPRNAVCTRGSGTRNTASRAVAPVPATAAAAPGRSCSTANCTSAGRGPGGPGGTTAARARYPATVSPGAGPRRVASVLPGTPGDGVLPAPATHAVSRAITSTTASTIATVGQRRTGPLGPLLGLVPGRVQLAARRVSSAPARSAGGSLTYSTQRPSPGWWKPSRWACSHWRVRPRVRASVGSAP